MALTDKLSGRFARFAQAATLVAATTGFLASNGCSKKPERVYSEPSTKLEFTVPSAFKTEVMETPLAKLADENIETIDLTGKLGGDVDNYIEFTNTESTPIYVRVHDENESGLFIGPLGSPIEPGKSLRFHLYSPDEGAILSKSEALLKIQAYPGRKHPLDNQYDSVQEKYIRVKFGTPRFNPRTNGTNNQVQSSLFSGLLNYYVPRR